MAIFGIGKKNKEVKETTKTEVSKAKSKVVKTKTVKEKKVSSKAIATTSTPVVTMSAYNHLILRPRITEKSGMMSESLNLYTFEVTKDSTKPSIEKAIKSLYKVTPLKVRIVNLPAKKVFVRGKRGVQSSVKKALIYLKKGDKIEFV